MVLHNDGKNVFSELGFSNWKKVNNGVNCAFVCHEGSIPNSPHNLCVKSCVDLMAHSKHIDKVLDRHSDETVVNNRLRGQGYDGASNMRGEWNGLQALFLKGYPFAYYIHCLAHRLQLALVSVAKEVCYVHQFFSKLTLIVNVVTVSPKRHDQLRVAQTNNVANLIANDQIVTGSGLNQIGTLQRAGDTRWGSHLNSACSLLCMFDATCEVLEKSIEEGNYSTRGDASAAYDAITSFEFVFVLHLMRNILEVSHDLCQALQQKNQDILNALTLVSTTKTLIQRMRESSWEAFIKEVVLFCEKHEVEVPYMNALHIARRGRTRKIVDQISVEHHYHVNLFLAIIDTQLQELNGRFNDNIVELLTLSSTLDLRENYKLFSVNKSM
ncbi:uncharacterized protein LOC107458503 [Arachis duranensis]|uniref:Uncharacterized protein LOC107458503 n=1 Tax=Arachis duranensis TaxID=130453 RepID=A0A6P4B138_ARADU|nr:uncharacterized protein LOC107458503 [Arachis duranensis]